MFANPEEAALQLRQLLGTEGSLVIASASDGIILAGELRLGQRFYNSIQPTSLFDILPPWQRAEFRAALSNLDGGWQEKNIQLSGQEFKTLFFSLDFGRGAAAAIHFKPVGSAETADVSNLSFLLKAGVKAAVLFPQDQEITWLTGQDQEKLQGLEEEFSMNPGLSDKPSGVSLTGINIRALMQVSAGTGQNFQAQNIWSETESKYFDVEIWPELNLGHVQFVNAVLIPSRKMPHQQRVLSAAGVFAAFSTNPFGRKPVVHIDPANTASASRLHTFLHEGNPDFLEYCRKVTEFGHGQMDISMLNGQELILESSLEAAPGSQQGLFHLIRVPFLNRVNGQDNGESSSTKEVELLLKESNHRIKNSISLVASLLQIQASELKSDKAKAALGDSVNRMHTISQLHEAIYRQLQQDKTLDVRPYLEDILDRLRKSVSGKKIVFKWDIESHNLPTGVAGTLGMLVNEIVQNSLKHAFKENGKGLVGVSFYRIENMYYLSAEDNGGGDPDTKSWKESDSLGASLIEEFVSQLGGKVRLERQTGTRYLITFHVPNE